MITDEQIKEASTLWADDYDRSSDREIAELSHYEGAQWAISLQPEPTLSNDDLTGRAIKIYTMAFNRSLSEFIKLYKEAYSQPPTK